MKKFTFKKDEPARGLAAMADHGGGTIKLCGKPCGFYQGNADGEFNVFFSVVDPESKCGWKHIRLRKKFMSEGICRTWLQAHTAEILGTVKLYFNEK